MFQQQRAAAAAEPCAQLLASAFVDARGALVLPARPARTAAAFPVAWGDVLAACEQGAQGRPQQGQGHGQRRGLVAAWGEVLACEQPQQQFARGLAAALDVGGGGRGAVPVPPELLMSSVLKKRRSKIKKHHLRKRRRKNRYKSEKRQA